MKLGYKEALGIAKLAGWKIALYRGGISQTGNMRDPTEIFSNSTGVNAKILAADQSEAAQKKATVVKSTESDSEKADAINFAGTDANADIVLIENPNYQDGKDAFSSHRADAVTDKSLRDLVVKENIPLEQILKLRFSDGALKELDLIVAATHTLTDGLYRLQELGMISGEQLRRLFRPSDYVDLEKMQKVRREQITELVGILEQHEELPDKVKRLIGEEPISQKTGEQMNELVSKLRGLVVGLRNQHKLDNDEYTDIQQLLTEPDFRSMHEAERRRILTNKFVDLKRHDELIQTPHRPPVEDRDKRSHLWEEPFDSASDALMFLDGSVDTIMGGMPKDAKDLAFPIPGNDKNPLLRFFKRMAGKKLNVLVELAGKREHAIDLFLSNAPVPKEFRTVLYRLTEIGRRPSGNSEFEFSQQFMYASTFACDMMGEAKIAVIGDERGKTVKNDEMRGARLLTQILGSERVLSVQTNDDVLFVETDTPNSPQKIRSEHSEIKRPRAMQHTEGLMAALKLGLIGSLDSPHFQQVEWVSRYRPVDISIRTGESKVGSGQWFPLGIDVRKYEDLIHEATSDQEPLLNAFEKAFSIKQMALKDLPPRPQSVYGYKSYFRDIVAAASGFSPIMETVMERQQILLVSRDIPDELRHVE